MIFNILTQNCSKSANKVPVELISLGVTSWVYFPIFTNSKIWCNLEILSSLKFNMFMVFFFWFHGHYFRFFKVDVKVLLNYVENCIKLFTDILGKTQGTINHSFCHNGTIFAQCIIVIIKITTFAWRNVELAYEIWKKT